MFRTYQPKKIQRKKEHGFRKRMKTANGPRSVSAAKCTASARVWPPRTVAACSPPVVVAAASP